MLGRAEVLSAELAMHRQQIHCGALLDVEDGARLPSARDEPRMARDTLIAPAG